MAKALTSQQAKTESISLVRSSCLQRTGQYTLPTLLLSVMGDCVQTIGKA